MRHSILKTAALGAAVLLPLAGATAQTSLRATTGTTSVRLDTTTLASAANLTLSSANGTGTAADPSFQVGFAFVGGTDFSFSIANGFAPVSGSILHSGSVTFNAGTPQQVVLGNFRIGFNATRIGGGRSGFFVENTLAPLGNVILFDIGTSLQPSANVGATSFRVTNGTLLVSAELGAFLQANGFAGSNLAGAQVGVARIDGRFIVASDRTKPTVSITGPRTIRVNTATAVVRGRTGDDISVRRVEFRLPGGQFRRAAGTPPNWSARVRANERPTRVIVRAVDASGNRSTPVTVTVVRR